jgi:hypothetical protein
MSEFFKSELKDKFLQYALDRDDYFEAQLLYDEFLRPNYSLEYVERLLTEIIEEEPELLDIMSANGVKIFMLSATAFTEDFLEEGGFTSIYVKEEEKWDTFLEQLSNNKELSKRERAKLGASKSMSKKRERRLLKLLIAAVAISFLFTFFSVTERLFFKEDYMTRGDLDKAIKEIQSKNSDEDNFFKDTTDLTDYDTVEKVTDSVLSKDNVVGQKP